VRAGAGAGAGGGAALLLATALAACGEAPPSRQPSPDGLRPGRAAAAAPARPVPLEPPVPAAAASAVTEKNDRYDFSYRYPAAAAAVPQIARALDAERDDLLTKLRTDTAEAKRDAAKDGFDYRPYSTEVEWKVVTETPRFLSLSSEGYDYTGGAHGMPGYDALLWDKRAGRRLEATATFASPAALSKAVRGPFCKALDAERRRRRGGETAAVVADDPFNSCPPLSDATLLLGSSDRRAIDRLGFVIGPYVAGPYAEGAYELTLPVTPAVRAAVRTEYRDAFAARR